jgi:hypothetical protein
MRILGLLVAGGIVVAGGTARSQESAHWSDIDCGQSKLAVPGGLKCRATQEYSGGSRIASGSGPTGMSRDWAALGKVNDSRLYYFGKEALTSKSSVFPYVLADAVKSLSPQGKGAKGFSEAKPMSGGDYVRFTSASGEACVGIKKEGPARPKGFLWIVIATKCQPAGTGIPDQDVATFIANADFHA